MVNKLNPVPNAARSVGEILKFPAAPLIPIDLVDVTGANCKAPVPVTDNAPPENVTAVSVKIFKLFAFAFNVLARVSESADNVLLAVAPPNETASL